MTDLLFEKLYPDVLGAITGGVRVSMGALQCALGVFPRVAFINQPFEVVLILQNMVDEPMEVQVAVQLPETDNRGNPAVFDMSHEAIKQALQPSEVGVLRIPVVALPPTMPGTDFPVYVTVRHKTSRNAQMVRPAAGGAPPTVLNVSAFKLQALRDVEFVMRPWDDSSEVVAAHFDIAPRRLPPAQHSLVNRYETLWTREDAAEERQHAASKIEEARKIAISMTSTELYAPLLHVTEEKFMQRGMTLETAEIKAITKMVTYTLTDATNLDKTFIMERSRWFKTLCFTLAYDEKVSNWNVGEMTARFLYEPGLYDSVLLGFRVVQPRIREPLGTREERVSHAERVIGWFGGLGEPDWSYVYLPLVMGGISLNLMVGFSFENPWIMLEQLRETVRRRERLVHEEAMPMFDIVNKLLDRGEDDLVREHIGRP